MVGVAGKSKGCKTCRQRKIGCGLQRPRCAQCTRSNRICLGYDKDIYFVPVQARPTDKKTVMRSSFSGVKRITSGRSSGPASTPATPHEAETKREIDTTIYTFCENTPALDRDHLSVATTRQQLINAFITTCVPVSDLQRGRTGPWLVLLAQFQMKTKALEIASLAISAAALGRMNNDTTLVKESLKLYTRGLRELQKALWNSNLMYDDETFAACLSLSLYELMECPGDAYSAYVSHCTGCLKLVEARGVERHTSDVAHELFVGFRSQAVIMFSADNDYLEQSTDHVYYQILLGLENKKSNFLSSPLWLEGPWKGRPKRVSDRLIDFLAMGPSIFQQVERFQTLRSKPLLNLVLEIVDHCWAVAKALQEIYEDLERESVGSLYWPTLSEHPNAADDPAIGKVFTVAFQFPDLAAARTLMMYWALAVMVWSGMSSLYSFIPTIEVDPADAFCLDYPDCVDPDSCVCRHLTPTASGSLQYDASTLPSLGHRADYLTPARNVCQSVEYCCNTAFPMFGVFSVSTPLIMVFETMRHDPRFASETAWMAATLNTIQNRGLRILNYSIQK